MNRASLSVRLVATCCAAALCGGAVAAELQLVHDGQAEAVIVVADDPLPACGSEMGSVSGTQRTAAEALQKYLEKASGARLPTVPASEAPETGTLVLVGQSAVSDRHGLAPPTRPGGLRVTSLQRGMALLGEIADADDPANNTDTDLDCGVFDAVDTFLEREISFRFYLSVPQDEELGIVIPRKTTLSVPQPVAYEDAPAFSLRQNHGLGHPGASRGGAADRFQANHTHLGWRDMYQQSHPGFFPLNADGSRSRNFLCYSEPGVVESELRHLEGFHSTGRLQGMSASPTRRFIPVLPDDNWPACHCERCAAKAQGGLFWGSRSNLWFDYVRRLALEVGRRCPDTRVATLAYRDQTLPPEFELPDNVDVMVCIHPYGPGVPISQLFLAKEPNVYGANLDLMRRWSEKLGGDRARLSFWDYYLCSDAHTGMPTLFPRTLQSWLRDVRPISRGVFIDGGGACPAISLCCGSGCACCGVRTSTPRPPLPTTAARSTAAAARPWRTSTGF